MGAFSDDFYLALADYTIQFPDLASLGVSAATWKTEYDRVKEAAFGPVLITSTGSDGTSAAGSRGFDQRTLLNALHYRRNQLDATYTLPAHLGSTRSSAGFVMRFGP